MPSAPNESGQTSEYRHERYGPGEDVATLKNAESVAAKKPLAKPGDFILTHSSGFYGRLIRVGESLRYWGKNKVFAHWSHAAIFVNDDGDIIEALGGGVQRRNISVYHDTEYTVVHLPDATTPLDREEAVKFARHCLHDQYGWLTILSIGLSLVTGARINFAIDGQQICSALVARSVERIGEIFTENEPWQIMPADLAKHFDVSEIGERGRIPDPDAGVEAYSRPGRKQLRESS